MPKPSDWNEAELEAIVADYLEMLRKERAGIPYVKAHHRRALVPLLAGRTDGAVEMKHCNISAVLNEMGLRYIDGYKPRTNLQHQLREVVARHVSTIGGKANRQ